MYYRKSDDQKTHIEQESISSIVLYLVYFFPYMVKISALSITIPTMTILISNYNISEAEGNTLFTDSYVVTWNISNFALVLKTGETLSLAQTANYISHESNI